MRSTSGGCAPVAGFSAMACRSSCNDRYGDCVVAWQERALSKDAKSALPSYDRFAAVSTGARVYETLAHPAEHGFTILDRAKNQHLTVWQIVYDSAGRALTLKRKADAMPVIVNFRDLTFAPDAPALAFDLTRVGELKWAACTPQMNRELVIKNCRRTPFLSHIDVSVFEEIARLPEQFTPGF